VNLTDYADTGLFLDHRSARGMIRDLCDGKRVLNLFAYTGAFSVYAAAGGASEITSVDLSATYLEWAQRNFAINGLQSQHYQFVRDDITSFVENLPEDAEFDIVVCDPPTFSNSKRTESVWDVQQQYADLLNALMSILSRDGTLFFSSNFRRFRFEQAEIEGAQVREITKRTIPEDFRNQRVHRSWLIRHANAPD
jgi:23S rRNA (cytosine1962-C5)-methyltransferase